MTGRVRTASPALLVLICLTGFVVPAPSASAAVPGAPSRTPAATASPLFSATATATSSAPVLGKTHPNARSAVTDAMGAPGTGLHWLLTPGRSILVVEVVVTTSARWPLRAASRQWATPHLRLEVVSSCQPAAPRVVVHEHSCGHTGWVGLTTATADQMSTFHSPVLVQLNDSYGLTGSQYQAVACHELGHALGLDHTSRSTSCLQPVPRSPRPDRTDRTQLERMYAPSR